MTSDFLGRIFARAVNLFPNSRAFRLAFVMVIYSVDFHLPKQVRVAELLSSRYANGERPLSWELRKSGLDKIRSDDGAEILLNSEGGQSPPKPGWLIVLESGSEDKGFSWTLFGLPKALMSSSVVTGSV